MERSALAGGGLLGAGEGITDYLTATGNNLLGSVASFGGIVPNPVSKFFEDTAKYSLQDDLMGRCSESIDRRYRPNDAQRALGGINEAGAAMLPAMAATTIAGPLAGNGVAIVPTGEGEQRLRVSQNEPWYGKYAGRPLSRADASALAERVVDSPAMQADFPQVVDPKILDAANGTSILREDLRYLREHVLTDGLLRVTPAAQGYTAQYGTPPRPLEGGTEFVTPINAVMGGRPDSLPLKGLDAAAQTVHNVSGGDLSGNDTGTAGNGVNQNGGGLYGEKAGFDISETESSRARSYREITEPAGTFLTRAGRAGKILNVDEFGNYFAYREVQTISESAARVKKLLEDRGISSFVCDGFERNKDGLTTQHLTDALTISDGRVAISNQCALPVSEIAGHEGFHAMEILAPDIASPYMGLLSKPNRPEVQTDLKKFRDYLGVVMYGNKYDYQNESHTGHAMQELAAQIGGKMDSDAENARDLFTGILDDFDATYAMWKKVNRDFDARNVGGPNGYGHNTVGAAQSGGAPTNEQLVEEFGVLRKGEHPRAREVDLPQETRDGLTSRFVQNAAESAVVNDKTVDNLKTEIETGTFSYQPISDKKALNTANARLEQLGVDGALAEFDALVGSGRMFKKSDIVIGERLIQEAVKRGDYDTAVRLVADVTAIGTELGQSVQAFRVLKRLTPEGNLMALQRTVNRINAQNTGKKGKLQVQIPQENAADILSQTTQKGIEQANAGALNAVADQMPANWADKWNAWRYTAMLANPTTHIRNILGNAVFIPARKFKNIIATGIEHTLPRGDRTKSILNPFSKADRALVKFAKVDFRSVSDAISNGGKMNPADVIRDNRTIFKTKPLEAVRKGNNFLLGAEDDFFSKNAYADSLAQYMKANRLTEADLGAAHAAE